MSNWTHVLASIRIDDLRWNDSVPDFDKLIGKECLWEDSPTENTLPLGSEGSLQKSVWINPRESDCAAYTVTIFGDLRDTDSAETYIEWFKGKCAEIEQNYVIRQAFITARNEQNGTLDWRYGNGN